MQNSKGKKPQICLVDFLLLDPVSVADIKDKKKKIRHKDIEKKTRCVHLITIGQPIRCYPEKRATQCCLQDYLNNQTIMLCYVMDM